MEVFLLGFLLVFTDGATLFPFYDDDDSPFSLEGDEMGTCNCASCSESLIAGKYVRPSNFSGLYEYLDWQRMATTAVGKTRHGHKKKNIPATTVNKTIDFGFLIHVKYPQVLGAVSAAVHRINGNSSILPNHTLTFRFERLRSKYSSLTL